MVAHLNDYAVSNDNNLSDVLFANCDPISFEEAVKNNHWNQVMDKEFHAIENKTWELTRIS